MHPTQYTPYHAPLSRRSLLKAAAAAACMVPSLRALATTATPAAPTAAASDAATDLRARAKALLESTLAVDMHSHVGGTGANRPVDDFDQLKASGLAATCLSIASDHPLLARAPSGKLFAKRQPAAGELHSFTLERLDFADRMIAQKGLQRITSLADLQQARANKKVGIILATEGADFLERKLENLDVLHARGVRHFQLVHYRADNGIADIQTEPVVDNGATPLGLDMVRACNKLGLVVDVAHATLQAVKQIAEVSSTPLILSHTEFGTKPGKLSRVINADHARVVAQTGGVVGVWTSAMHFTNAADFAQGVARMAEVAGVDHVGIGTDKNGLPHPMMQSYADFPELVAALLQQFNEDELRKILGGNYLRVFGKATQMA